jgi:hypothetical protein
LKDKKLFDNPKLERTYQECREVFRKAGLIGCEELWKR